MPRSAHELLDASLSTMQTCNMPSNTLVTDQETARLGSLPGHLITVVIPAYNAERFIGRALSGALSQTYKPLECIVVDDGSHDDTAKVARQFGELVRVIRQKNAGAAAARNAGLQAASGEFIAFLDADDYWHPLKIEKQAAVMDSEPDVVLVTCKLADHDPSINLHQTLAQHAVSSAYEQRVTLYDNLLPLFLDPYIGTPTVMVRRERALEVCGFDTSLIQGEDIDFFFRVCSGHKYARLEEVLTFIHRRPGSLSHSAPSQPYNLEVLDRLAQRHPSFATEHAELFRKQRLALFEQWAAHQIIRGEGAAARRILWQSRTLGRCDRYWELLIKSILAPISGRPRR